MVSMFLSFVSGRLRVVQSDKSKVKNRMVQTTPDEKLSSCDCEAAICSTVRPVGRLKVAAAL